MGMHLHIHSDDVVQNEHEHYNEKEHKHAVQTQTQTQSQTQTQKGSNMPTPVKTGSGYAQKQTYLTKKTGTGVYTQKQAYLAKNNGLHAVQTQTQQGSNRRTPVKTGSGYAKKQTYSAKKTGLGILKSRLIPTQKLKGASLVQNVLVEVRMRTHCATLEDALRLATSFTLNATNIRTVPARASQETVFAYKADALDSVGSATTQQIARRWQSAKESSAFAVTDVILKILKKAHVN